MLGFLSIMKAVPAMVNCAREVMSWMKLSLCTFVPTRSHTIKPEPTLALDYLGNYYIVVSSSLAW